MQYFILQENSSSEILPGSNDSGTCNSLPYPVKPITEEFETSESTFFKYRKQPKPPIRTTLSLSSEVALAATVPTPLSSQESPLLLSNLEGSDSVDAPPKKSPPPTLPKPKYRLSQDSFDRTSFREFDEMLKNLNLSFC